MVHVRQYAGAEQLCIYPTLNDCEAVTHGTTHQYCQTIACQHCQTSRHEDTNHYKLQTQDYFRLLFIFASISEAQGDRPNKKKF